MDRDELSDLIREVVGELFEEKFGTLRADLASLRSNAKALRRDLTAARQ